MVHVPPAPRAASTTVIVVVPVPLTVAPQSLNSTLSKVRPVRASPRASVKSIAEAACPASRLVRVNSRVTVPPGATGSSVNALVSARKVEATSSSSVAGGRKNGVPSMMAKLKVVPLG